MTISAQYAETTVADLLSAADNGEEVIIARPGKPALRLVADTVSEPATVPTTEAPSERKPRILGALRGQMRVPSEEEWAEMDRQIAAEMNDRPLFSSVTRLD